MSSAAPSSSSSSSDSSSHFHQLPDPFNKLLSLQDALQLWNRLKDIPHDNALALVRGQLVPQIKQLENAFIHEIRTNAVTLTKLIQSPEATETATVAKSREIDLQLRRLYTMVKDKRLAIEQVILAAAPPRQPGTSSSTTNTRRPLTILVPPRSAHDTQHNVPTLTPSPSTALSLMNVVMIDHDQKQPPPQSRPPTTDKNPTQYYTKIRTLRQTLFGKLKLFTRHSDSRLVAIKLSSKQLVMERKTIAGATVSENPQQELNVLRRLNSGGGHRHILQLVEELEDEHYYWTVLEFAGKGEFFDLIKKERFSDARTRHYFLQMCHGVMHMHACGYCHLDLSLENLLMDDQDELKICDFGLARELIVANDEIINTRTHQQQILHQNLTSMQTTYQQQHTTWTTEQQTHVMTQMQTLSLQMHALSVNPYREIKFQGEPHNKPGKIAYMAPEIFQGRDFDGRACDIWSMGVILFMSLTGVPPFNHPAVSDQRFRHIYTGAIDTLLKAWNMLDVVSPHARDLITRMLAPADRRITMEQILQHPWVTLQNIQYQQQQPPS